ncbi:MAG: hypothetical protein HY874_04530 [Chloroflexi bacterium]|nr:hypothetical protein [Chloroflexota bacterium]
MEPRDYAERVERAPELPPGSDERFQGYGVMGEPFASGHVLAMRRFPASSVGAGYTSVWHREPAGGWTFYADTAPLRACTRYFGSDVQRAVECQIDVSWPGPRTLHISIESAALTWEAEFAPSFATRMLNTMARLMPDPLWKDRRVLSLMAAIAGPALRAGRLGVHGRAPNGQQFSANPMVLWTIVRGTASLGETDLGPPGRLARQARLGDFWIPQRGLFTVGRAFFEPFDPARHLAVASREASPARPI